VNTVERALPRRIGRYELHDAIGRGGMASVHLGRLTGPVGFARTVAIKCLYPQYANDQFFVSMFIDEARLASRLRHPNLVPILDVLAEGGELFLVMDYVRGVSLAELLKTCRAQKQEVPVGVAVSLMVGVLSGLHAAHEATGDRGEPLGIVHRDVSPQNIMVAVDGVARVLDFGIALASSRVQSTEVGQIKGKVAYMSPEQVRGESVNRQSDVFAASAVLWETLVGEPLFLQADRPAMVSALLHGTLARPSERRAEIAPELDAVVMSGLARELADRPVTCLALVEALERCGPMATAREVGEWLRAVAGDMLERDAAAIAQVENVSVVTAPAVAQAPPEAVPEPPASAAGARPFTHRQPLERRWAVLSAIAGGVVLVAVLLVLVGARLLWKRAPVEAAAAPVPSVTAQPVALISEPPSSASSAPESAAAPKPKAPAPRAGGHARRAPTPHASTAPCRIVNPDGTFGFRPECLK
jgi:hypothetical protein